VEKAGRDTCAYALAKLGVLYESRGGQTEKIAWRMAVAVKELVGEVQVADIRNLPAGFDLYQGGDPRLHQS